MRFTAEVDHTFTQAFDAAQQRCDTVQVHVRITVESLNDGDDPKEENQFAEHLGDYLRRQVDAGMDLFAMLARLQTPHPQRDWKLKKKKKKTTTCEKGLAAEAA